MDCETIWQVVISTPAPVHYAAPAQAATYYTTASSAGGGESLIGLVAWLVGALIGLTFWIGGLLLFLWVIGCCLEAIGTAWDSLFSDPPPPRTTMTSVASDARRQIDDLSDSYVRSSARKLFGG